MSRDEEIVKIRFSIRCLELASENELMKERSEAFKHGAIILNDYLKHLILYK